MIGPGANLCEPDQTAAWLRRIHRVLVYICAWLAFGCTLGMLLTLLYVIEGRLTELSVIGAFVVAAFGYTGIVRHEDMRWW